MTKRVCQQIVHIRRLRDNKTIGRQVVGPVQVDVLWALHLGTPTERTRLHLVRWGTTDGGLSAWDTERWLR